MPISAHYVFNRFSLQIFGFRSFGEKKKDVTYVWQIFSQRSGDLMYCVSKK